MNLPIVYYHPYASWDVGGSRQRYLMEELSAYTRIFYLNPPQAQKYRFVINKPRAHQVNAQVTVIDNAFAFRSSPVGRRALGMAISAETKWLHALLRDKGVSQYVYWLSAPSPELTYGMDCDNLIYDCIDPSFSLADNSKYDSCEQEVAKRARVVFCTAQILLERIRQWNSVSYLLPNACDLQEYSPEANVMLGLPEELTDRPRPVIGYMGHMDIRFDFETVYAAACALPNYTFALVGGWRSDLEAQAARLRALPNVVMPGPVSNLAGRQYTQAFDVALIPFTPGGICDAINSVKMYMYLAAGKPVVSTWVRECYSHTPYVRAAKTPSDFIQNIQAALHSNMPADITARLEFARQNTWQTRAEYASSILKQAGIWV